jgi:NAD(P)-dependent dehydrogenase (short-subunit alcohol dehydrogenase family)
VYLEIPHFKQFARAVKWRVVQKKYRQSKVAFMMLTFKIAEEFKTKGLKVNALQINGAKLLKRNAKQVYASLANRWKNP